MKMHLIVFFLPREKILFLSDGFRFNSLAYLGRSKFFKQNDINFNDSSRFSCFSIFSKSSMTHASFFRTFSQRVSSKQNVTNKLEAKYFSIKSPSINKTNRLSFKVPNALYFMLSLTKKASMHSSTHTINVLGD